MPRLGLNQDKICREAMRLVAEKGCARFSLRELAGRLGVKPASIYEHISGAGAIAEQVGIRAIEALAAALEESIRDPDREQAFRNFGRAYRTFAKENPELYRAILALPKTTDARLRDRERETIEPLRKLIGRFVTEPENLITCQRLLRSGLHGFVALELDGFMRDRSVTVEKSFESLLDAGLRDLLRAAAEEQGKTRMK